MERSCFDYLLLTAPTQAHTTAMPWQGLPDPPRAFTARCLIVNVGYRMFVICLLKMELRGCSSWNIHVLLTELTDSYCFRQI